MAKKIFGTKSITHLIYGLLMLMPFVAIGIKSAYVVINKNAYQSYSGTNQNTENTFILRDIENYQQQNNYYLQNAQYQSVPSTTESTGKIYFNLIENNSTYTNLDNATSVVLYEYANNYTMYYIFYDENGTQLYNLNSSNSFNLKISIVSYDGSHLSTINDILTKSNVIYYIDYYTEQQLDNVFYYAVDEIISDNNIGLIDFTSWFNGLVLPSNNFNNRFIGYANWYMNYAILISCVYILFLCLLWFANFARKLLDRGMNYDF